MLEYVGASLDHLGSAVLGEQVAVPGYHLSGSSIYYPSLYQVTFLPHLGTLSEKNYGIVWEFFPVGHDLWWGSK